jgi:hypothetical protein
MAAERTERRVEEIMVSQVSLTQIIIIRFVGFVGDNNKI